MLSVSVITTLYKGEKYVAKLLDMMNQNYEFILKHAEIDFEYILVNDYPDEHIDLSCYKYKYKIKLINNETNLGLHKSRIIGLNNSKSEFIYMLDQDDIIEQNCLFEHINNIGDCDASILNGYHKLNSVNVSQLIRNKFQAKKIKKLSTYLCICNPIFSPGQVLIRRKSIPHEWTNSYLTINGSDDYMLWILLLTYGKSFVVGYDKFVYSHVNTGQNLSLDCYRMYQSDMETLERLKENNIKINYHNFGNSIYLNYLIQKRNCLKIVLFAILHPMLFCRRLQYTFKMRFNTK